MTLFIDLSKAFLTPLIAIIVAWIAFQQWQINKKKLKLDLYDRRYEVYKATLIFFSEVCQRATVSDEHLDDFRRGFHDVDFLFKKDIVDFVNSAYKQGLKLNVARFEYRDVTQLPFPEGYDHEDVCERMHSAQKWFLNNFEEVKGRFKPYLDFEKVL